MLERQIIYWTIPVILWLASVLGYSVAYGTFLTSPSVSILIPAYASVYLAGAVPAIGFLGTAWPTMRGRTQIGRSFMASVIIVGLLVVVWFVVNWDHGVQYQGASTVYVLLVLNLVTFSGVLFAVWALMSTPNLWGKFLLHAVFWVWVGWLAFPVLGEFP